MEVSNASALKGTNFFCTVSSLRYSSTSLTRFRKNPSRINVGHPILLPKIPYWGSSRGVLEISARFGRPSRRRNTLREKLVVSGEDQVRKFPEFSNPDSNLQDSNFVHDETKNTESSLDGDSERVAETGSLEKLNLSGDSVLWGKLENWVDQYKKDSEFWGIGAGPVFMIYQDSDGNVIRVSVNEDEIAKRSRVVAWSFEDKEEATEEFTDVNSKISYAKLIAKQIETGEYTPPKNSSVAKFVVEGKKSSFVDGLRSGALRSGRFLKLDPRIGFMVLCGCFVFWAAKKLFVGNDRVELTREEKEMLRRKIKSRRKRENVEKGSVEVLESVQELPMVFDRRPQLDKNELMKSVVQAKALRESLVIPDSSSNFDASDLDFDDKVREIREMVRQVRELEQQEHSQINKEGEVDDVPSIMLDAKDQNSAVGSNTSAEAESIKQGSDHDSISEINSLVDHSKKMKSSKDIGGSTKMYGEKSVDCQNNTPDGESYTTFPSNGDTRTAGVNDIETGTTRCSREMPVGVKAEGTVPCNNANTLSVYISKNKERIGQHEKESALLEERESNNSSSDTLSSFSKSSARTKPKIIRSVKEAREYLAQRRGFPKDEVQPYLEVQQKMRPAGVKLRSSTYDDKPNDMKNQASNESTTSQAINESTKLAELSKLNGLQGVSDATLALEPYGDVKAASMLKGLNLKSHADDTENKMLSMEIEDTKVQGEKKVDFQSDIPDAKSGKPLSVHGDIDSSFLDDFETGEMVCSSETLHGVDEETMNRIGQSQEFTAPTDKGKPVVDVCDVRSNEEPSAKEGQTVSVGSKMVESTKLDMPPDPTSVVNSSDDSTSKEEELDENGCQFFPVRAGKSGDLEASTCFDAALDCSGEEDDMKGLSRSVTNSSQDSDMSDCDTRVKPFKSEKSWIENNFQEFEPIVKEIRAGFEKNYLVAKEKVQEQSSLSTQISELGLVEDDEELEWMNDESLREIVFQVRENELAGRDPFHLMDDDDQRAFFKGLERKAEKMNEKLLTLHEWVHSRVENLDYGADGISLHDPPEKIIPRWKGPPIDKNPEFVKDFTEHRKAFVKDFTEHRKAFLDAAKENTQVSLQKSEELPNGYGVSLSSPVCGIEKGTNPTTLIECSDGSFRAGKQSGKEHWQHTKKWSRGFLEVYNAETDPEIKSIMKDMGKDLDRWMTDKEIQDAADLMTRIPKRKRRFIEKKMDKLKKEMETFGAQAVVSKYREYSEEKEEDYLWWLDLRFVLCIELYTVEDDIQKVGFYCLEMAADLELNPKPYHVIAFEDPGDSKNLCYIVQAHMDMLGSGRAFVVARPPKDAFREAKANGFSVTVIRKGEVILNVDQTLEEVEEQIVEIGSKVYHDKIMSERSIDMSAIMKGVLGSGKSTKRRSKRILTKP